MSHLGCAAVAGMLCIGTDVTMSLQHERSDGVLSIAVG